MAKQEKKSKHGRPITLTVEIAEQLKFLWGLSGEETLSDKDIAKIVLNDKGEPITFGQLQGWLGRNTPVTITQKDSSGKDVKRKIGLRNIRTGARVNIKADYISRLIQLSYKAEAKEDYKTAANIIQWLLEKQFPKEFGAMAGKSSEEGEGVKVIKMPFGVICEQSGSQLEEKLYS